MSSRTCWFASGSRNNEFTEPTIMSCNGDCGHCAHKEEEDQALCKLRHNLSGIKNIVMVMSGKGGVGKSTVAVNLAAALKMAGRKVGLLDVDFHGPSVPTMLGLVGQSVDADEDGTIYPCDAGGIKVLSTGLVIPNPDDPIIWRGPVKAGVMQQFLGQTAWGDLDYLVLDVPPGTGDEPLSVCQLLAESGPGIPKEADVPHVLGAVVVTTPQKVAETDVAKSISFCKKLSFPVLGLVENMAYFQCPDCGKKYELFRSGAAQTLSDKFQVPVLGRIPIDPQVCEGGDAGTPFMQRFPGSAAAGAFAQVVGCIEAVAEH